MFGNESSLLISLVGTKVPGNESSRERKFHLWNFNSFLGTKVPVTKGRDALRLWINVGLSGVAGTQWLKKGRWARRLCTGPRVVVGDAWFALKNDVTFTPVYRATLVNEIQFVQKVLFCVVFPVISIRSKINKIYVLGFGLYSVNVSVTDD